MFAIVLSLVSKRNSIQQWRFYLSNSTRQQNTQVRTFTHTHTHIHIEQVLTYTHIRTHKHTHMSNKD